MAWIESHQTLRDDPKLHKAARLLGVSWLTMIGHLHCLWWWALDHAEDGDLSGYDYEELARAAAYEGEQNVVDALLDCGKSDGPGFLERDASGRLLIHDWWEYAGRLIEKRAQSAQRVQSYRARNAHVTRTERVPNAHETPLTVPYLTVPNQGNEMTAASPAWIAFTNARGINLSASDSQFVQELETLYSSDAVAQAIIYCDQHKRDNFLRLSYIQKMLSSWQAEGTLGLHPNGSEAKRGNGHGNKTPAGKPVLISDTHSNEDELRRALGLGPNDPIPDEDDM